MEKGKKIEIPVLDWFERYKRLIDLGYRSIMSAGQHVNGGTNGA